MTNKSYVGIDVKICPVCGNKIAQGILINTRLKDTLEKENVTGFLDGPCKSCHSQMYPEEGGERVALVSIDESKSKLLPNKTVDPKQAYRTGEICFLRAVVFEQMFDVPLPPNNLCFVDGEITRHLHRLASEV